MTELKRNTRLRAIAGRTGAGLVAMSMALVPIQKSGPSFTPVPAAGSVSIDNRCWTPKEWERGFVQLTNEARARSNEGALSLDPELSKAARVHTREMVRRDLLYHTVESDLRHRVTRWSTLGENVGVGGTVESLQDAFMNSPPHRANILYTPYRHVGVGVKEAAGRMWVTVLFESTSDPGTPLGMPHC